MGVKMVVEYSERDWVDPTPVEPEEVLERMQLLAGVGAVFQRVWRRD
ncbi:MAG: hypothetical protein HY555_03545 [Euryarchaeota archaeon]|nr:hypothetical protein [Euryarchaeota archaeon]